MTVIVDCWLVHHLFGSILSFGCGIERTIFGCKDATSGEKSLARVERGGDVVVRFKISWQFAETQTPTTSIDCLDLNKFLNCTLRFCSMTNYANMLAN